LDVSARASAAEQDTGGPAALALPQRIHPEPHQLQRAGAEAPLELQLEVPDQLASLVEQEPDLVGGGLFGRVPIRLLLQELFDVREERRKRRLPLRGRGPSQRRIGGELTEEVLPVLHVLCVRLLRFHFVSPFSGLNFAFPAGHTP
jgi:hypothetical protein